jgi:diguanylate cyclase (GGDEF)-like protein
VTEASLRQLPIRAKIVALLLAGTAAGYLLLILLQAVTGHDRAMRRTEGFSRNLTILLADQARAGVVRRDEDLVEAVYFDLVYDDHLDREHATVAALNVFDREGARIKNYASLDNPDPADAAHAALAAEAMRAGEVRERALDQHLLVGAPVRLEGGGDVVGAVTIAWDSGAVAASLRREALRDAGLAALLALLAVGAMLLAMEQVVIGPVARLAGRVLALGEGRGLGGAAASPLSGRADSVGVLAREFDRALGRLAEAQRDLRARNALFDAALSNMSQGLCMLDPSGRVIVANARYEEMFGLPAGAADGGPTLAEIAEKARALASGPGDNAEEAVEVLLAEHRALLEGRWSSPADYELGGGHAVAVSRRAMPGGGWVATYEDVSERRRAEARVAHMARHDALTDLPNRVLLAERLGQALAAARRHGEPLAVLCLDLDRFKQVNDTLGHPVGDALLRAVAERLKSCVREEDTVARLGGDEFAVVQVGLDQPEGAGALARRLVAVLGEPYEVAGHQLVVGASVGIALAPCDGGEADDLLKRADMALYRAKADGRGTYRSFESGMDAKLQARRLLELDLRRALAAGEFELHYQPLVDLRSSGIVAFEALLRWRHPERGMVPPAEFVPLAEEIGLIVPLGEWVLHRACADAAGWPGQAKVAVNLSAVQFKGDALVPAVVAALAASGLPACRLELEITEGVLLNDGETTLATLRELRASGVRIAMDDFGTGYSSLGYLRTFPFDKIKIDRSFVADLGTSADCEAIVRAVTGLGGSLGIVTTAEGVETAAQMERLRAEGCDQVQGYYFGRPVPAGQVAALLRGNTAAGRPGQQHGTALAATG